MTAAEKRTMFGRSVKSAVWVLLFALGAGAAGAVKTTAPPLPTYVCHKVSTPVVVDGKLDDAAWQRAPVFRDFRLTDGVRVPGDRTEFRACWDDKDLYLAYTCRDPDIVATMTKRDSGLYDEDCVEAFLSTGGDVHRYYEFEFSPHNVQMDASVHPNAKGPGEDVDYGWNCAGLRTAARITGARRQPRWTLEIAIPFDQIGRRQRTPAMGETWRTNFYRIDHRHGTRQSEDICWSPTIVDSFHEPDRFGFLVFAQ